jgi:hypothetical protein
MTLFICLKLSLILIKTGFLKALKPRKILRGLLFIKIFRINLSICQIIFGLSCQC